MEDGCQALERAEALLRFMREFAVEWRPAAIEQVSLMALSRKVIAGLKGDLVGVEIEMVGGEVVAPAEPKRLAQVVQNLLVNAAQAAKLLPTPRVRVHVYESRGDPTLSVRDNGPGISTENLERIFEPFFTTRREAGALGLGLPLCQEFALQMKAELSFSSAPGRGACFRLRFPRGT